MGTVFACEVTGEPYVQGRGRHGAGGRVYYSKASEGYREILVDAFKQLYHGDPIDYPIAATFKIKGGSAAGDLSNFHKQVEDALVQGAVLKDDNRKIVREIHIYDDLSGTAGIELVLERLEPVNG
jgi:Holliday junction resolvase RusA-like endonuclease